MLADQGVRIERELFLKVGFTSLDWSNYQLVDKYGSNSGTFQETEWLEGPWAVSAEWGPQLGVEWLIGPILLGVGVTFPDFSHLFLELTAGVVFDESGVIRRTTGR